jgi:drug/metabolite transporter (DMT)-like permease
MQIRSDATPQQVQEAAKLMRPRRFWFRFFTANWYASLLVAIVVGANVVRLNNGQPLRLGQAGLLLALAAAMFVLTYFLWNRKVCKNLQAATARIQSIDLDPEGVRIQLITGATTSVPWSSFSKWIEGETVFVLLGKDGTTILPAGDATRDSIRAMLVSCVR